MEIILDYPGGPSGISRVLKWRREAGGNQRGCDYSQKASRDAALPGLKTERGDHEPRSAGGLSRLKRAGGWALP